MHGYRKTTSEMHLAKMIYVFAFFRCLYPGFTNLQPKSLPVTPGNILHKLCRSSTKQICLAQARDWEQSLACARQKMLIMSQTIFPLAGKSFRLK